MIRGVFGRLFSAALRLIPQVLGGWLGYSWVPGRLKGWPVVLAGYAPERFSPPSGAGVLGGTGGSVEFGFLPPLGAGRVRGREIYGGSALCAWEGGKAAPVLGEPVRFSSAAAEFLNAALSNPLRISPAAAGLRWGGYFLSGSVPAGFAAGLPARSLSFRQRGLSRTRALLASSGSVPAGRGGPAFDGAEGLRSRVLLTRGMRFGRHLGASGFSPGLAGEGRQGVSARIRFISGLVSRRAGLVSGS